MKNKMQDKDNINLANEFHNEIDELIKNISEIHDTEDIQNDIISLFEDIIKFFSGREEDFLSLRDMPESDQREIYQEIMTIINILRNMSNKSAKKEIMAILSNRLIEKFIKNKKVIQKKEDIKKEEAKQIKALFAKVAMHQMQLFSSKLYNKMSSPVKLSSLKRKLNHFTNKHNNRIMDSTFEEREIFAKIKGKAASRKI